MIRHRTATTAGTLFGLVVTLGLAPGCNEPPVVETRLRPVRTTQVFASGGTQTRRFSGSARAGREIFLSFRVSGTVQRLPVSVGDRVKQGATLAALDPTDYDIAVRQAEAAVGSAQASWHNADRDLERVRQLYENSNASQNELDSATARASSAQADVDGRREALAAARQQRKYTRLTAPVDGSIAEKYVDVDENVQQGQRVVLMTAGATPEVEVGIPEGLIRQIQEGASVQVRFDSLRDQTFDAVVTEVGVSTIGSATTFPVTARLLRESRDIRPGMAASVEFRFEQPGNHRIYLPIHAVGGDDAGRFVFVLIPNPDGDTGVVQRTPVEVGGLNGPVQLEILSGLNEGQSIVTAGVRRLTDGQQVKLLPVSEADR
ncbi:efflux RND transporter periplasmic adaptor subunit [bacterium]|nr:efflux RND transporter periplasmic adaptor subunit [bacterium]